MLRRWVLTGVLASLALPAIAPAAVRPPVSWPPAEGRGLLFIHFGEEHWNDDDSNLTLPKVVGQTARYRPDLVTMSGDKDNDGTVEQLTRWKQIMSALDRAGVPYLPGVGNHDRTSPPGVPAGTAGLIIPRVEGSLANYERIFADRPFPFGDARNYPGIGPRRTAADAAGASSHYYADIGNVRWIFIDNSCWGIADCDAFQNPPFELGHGGQFQFLEHRADEARDQGRHVFVVMHMPTRDPRDQSYIDLTSFNHVMGKGLNPFQAPDNMRFEQVANRSGVDGVFLGHIKGMWTYRGLGEIPYYIDGGAGGELYTEGGYGTDHGYWHGFRLIRVSGNRIRSDVVPIFKRGAIQISGPDTLEPGRGATFAAAGEQPKVIEPVTVELRDPDPVRPASRQGGLMGAVGDFVRGAGVFVIPILVLLICIGLRELTVRRRRLAFASPTFAVIALGGLGAIAMAQEEVVPTTTPLQSLPNPARIWTSSDPLVLAPVGSRSDDARRNRKTQTQDGRFRACCPGKARIWVTSGFETRGKRVEVPSRPGPIVESVEFGQGTATVRLAQPARVFARVVRGGEVLHRLGGGCLGAGRPHHFRRGSPNPGRSLQILVLSDRGPQRYTEPIPID